MSGQDDGDKTYEPTQRRLDEARKRGEVPRSADLSAAASTAGVLVAALLTGPAAVLKIGEMGMTLLGQADRLAPQMAKAAQPAVGGVMLTVGGAVAMLFVLPLVGVLLASIGQRALIFSPEKIMPKWSRISPFAAARQRFGREGLFSFGKSLAKLTVVCVLLAAMLPSRSADLLNSLQMSPAQSSLLMMQMLRQFLFLALLSTTAFGVVDYGWQYFQHLRRNRMSRQEMVEEMKDSEGDPHVKSQRRQRAQEIALNQMLADVKTADVVVVNPTHYAVALKWKRTDRRPPVMVAKGVDEIAARIRERAAEAGVPIFRDPPTARALHATVEIGSAIHPDQFKAVAAAIRFAEAMRKRARSLRK